MFACLLLWQPAQGGAAASTGAQQPAHVSGCRSAGRPAHQLLLLESGREELVKLDAARMADVQRVHQIAQLLVASLMGRCGGKLVKGGEAEDQWQRGRALLH